MIIMIIIFWKFEYFKSFIMRTWSWSSSCLSLVYCEWILCEDILPCLLVQSLLYNWFAALYFSYWFSFAYWCMDTITVLIPSYINLDVFIRIRSGFKFHDTIYLQKHWLNFCFTTGVMDSWVSALLWFERVWGTRHKEYNDWIRVQWWKHRRRLHRTT